MRDHKPNEYTAGEMGMTYNFTVIKNDKTLRKLWKEFLEAETFNGLISTK
jgi:spermidine/putrescine-binding protein